MTVLRSTTLAAILLGAALPAGAACTVPVGLVLELTGTVGEYGQAAAKSIDGRAGMMSSQKSRWKRSLNEAETQWLGWRDTECQDVAPFEAGMGAKGGDPRLSCIIDQDARRVADIKARYP